MGDLKEPKKAVRSYNYMWIRWFFKQKPQSGQNNLTKYDIYKRMSKARSSQKRFIFS